MGQDRRMTGGEVDRMLQLAGQAAAQQQSEQQEMLARIQRAMQNPEVTESFKVAGIAIGADGGQRKLIVATPDGRRREFDLNPQIEQMLRQGLSAPLDQEREAA